MASKLRFGIMGTANIATKVHRAISRSGVAETVAIASRALDRAQAWGKAHGVGRAFGSYAELLDDPAIDAVYIPLPPSMHFQWTIRAASRGKHVLCEKPLATSAAEAREMADACRAAGVQLMDGVMWVHHDRTAAMRRLLDEAVLGELKRVTAAFTFRWDEVPRDNIRVQKDLAGGCLGDLGYYCVRAILWAFRALPERVFATARYEREVDYNLSALLWFPDRVASFDCGFDTVMRQWFEIAGTRGSLVCDDFVLPHSETKARFWIHDGTGRHEEHGVADCVQEVRMIQRFAELVARGRRDESWPIAALDTMRVCDALAESARSGTVVELRT